MSDSERDETSADEFKDPLSNYDSATYHDPLEKAIAQQTDGAVESQPCATIAPDTPVHQAVQRLSNLEVACLVVAENRRLLGVFTERDVLDKVALQFDEVKDRPVSEVMTPKPDFVYETDAVAAALFVMAASGHRHVPVLDPNERIVGIVSPIRVTTFLQRYFEHE